MSIWSNTKEVKTTIIGGVFFLIGIAWFVANFEGMARIEFRDAIAPSVFVLGGVLFLLAPDKILSILVKGVKNKVDGRD